MVKEKAYRMAVSFKWTEGCDHDADIYLAFRVNGKLNTAINFGQDIETCARWVSAIFMVIKMGSLGLGSMMQNIKCDPKELPKPSNMDVMVINSDPMKLTFLDRKEHQWPHEKRFVELIGPEYDKFMAEVWNRKAVQ